MTKRPASKGGQPEIREPERYTLDAAVEFINRRRDEIGEDRLIISVDEDGYLEVLQRSGR